MPRRHLALIAAAAALAAGFEAVLEAFGVEPGVALAPQLVAPGPFGVLHDLRWLMGFHASYGAFAGLVVALFVLRVGLLVSFGRLARPDLARAEPLAREVGRATAFVAVAMVLLTPSATFLFADAIAPLWWIFLAALVLGVVATIPLAGGAFPGWWRLPARRALGWAAVEVVALMVGALAITASPAYVDIVPAAATGAVSALAWIGIAEASWERALRRADEPTAPRHAPLGRATAVAALALVGVGAAIGVPFISAPSHAPQRLTTTRPVIFVAGFRSELHPGAAPLLGGAADVTRFSYRGLGPSGRPLPYGPRATYESLERSVAKLSHQVDVLARRAGRPVAIVSDSEGSLVAKLYLLTHSGAPVDELVLSSPIVYPARVAYPPGDGGYAIATKFALRRLAEFVSAAGDTPISVDTPFIRSIVRNAAVLRHGMLAPLPHVRQEVLLPLSNAIAEPPPVGTALPSAVLPAIHGDIANPGDFRRTVVLALARRGFPEYPAWRSTARIVRGLAAAWQMPSQPLGLIS